MEMSELTKLRRAPMTKEERANKARRARTTAAVHSAVGGTKTTRFAVGVAPRGTPGAPPRHYFHTAAERKAALRKALEDVDMRVSRALSDHPKAVQSRAKAAARKAEKEAHEAEVKAAEKRRAAERAEEAAVATGKSEAYAAEEAKANAKAEAKAKKAKKGR